MSDLFLGVLHTSLLAAAGMAAILPLRWIIRRIRLPSGLCVVLWMALLIRMLTPAGLFSSSASLVSWAAPAAQRQVETMASAVRPAVSSSPLSGLSQGQSAVQAPAVRETAPRTAPSFSPVRALPWVWLAGVLALWGYALFSWLALRRRLSAAVGRTEGPEGAPEVRWWESDRISAPFVLGVFHPRIYVPLGLEGDTLVWVLRHEQAHIRLGHPLCKLLFFLALGLHWFNPVLWLAWVLLCRDLELACDEHVLGRYPQGARAYSAALLCLASPRSILPLPSAFGEVGVKERIRRALRWRPASKWAACAALLLCCLLGVLLLRDPAAAQETGDPPPSPSPTSGEAASGAYPEVDRQGLRIRLDGSDTWTDLGPLLPAPAAWGEQDLGGRSDMDVLTNDLLAADPGLQIEFSSPLSGWLVYSSTQVLGPLSDTCIYRTSDGGHTWREVGYLTGQQEGAGDLWYSVNCAAFPDATHAILATGLFQGAPVFCTSDGGATWTQADIPLPQGAWQCTQILSAWPEEYRLAFTSPEGLGCVARSLDQGESWSVSQPIADPAEIPLEELPWPASLPQGSFSVNVNNYDNGLIKLVGLSDDRTAALFTFDYWLTGLNGVLLCTGGQLTYYPQIPWAQLPSPHAAPLTYGDYDGDGVEELALQLCMGTGTGVNEWALYLFEPAGTSYTLSASLTRADLAQMDLSALSVPGLPQGAAAGYWVRYTVSEDRIWVELAVNTQGNSLGSYGGQLEGSVVYDGQALSLSQLSYQPF